LELRQGLSHGKVGGPDGLHAVGVHGASGRARALRGALYLRRDEFKAAVWRAQHALRTYDGWGLEPEAMVLLGETYLKMHQQADARSTFSQVLAKYPSSAFSTSAKNFLLEMDRQGK